METVLCASTQFWALGEDCFRIHLGIGRMLLERVFHTVNSFLQKEPLLQNIESNARRKRSQSLKRATTEAVGEALNANLKNSNVLKRFIGLGGGARRAFTTGLVLEG